jgi:hypothetical protein
VTIRLAILSGVRHARDYLPILAGLPEFETVAVGEDITAPDWARADSQTIADQADVPLLGIEEALAAADAALVCSEPTRRAAIAAHAVRAGRHCSWTSRPQRMRLTSSHSFRQQRWRPIWSSPRCTGFCPLMSSGHAALSMPATSGYRSRSRLNSSPREA